MGVSCSSIDCWLDPVGVGCYTVTLVTQLPERFHAFRDTVFGAENCPRPGLQVGDVGDTGTCGDLGTLWEGPGLP